MAQRAFVRYELDPMGNPTGSGGLAGLGRFTRGAATNTWNGVVRLSGMLAVNQGIHTGIVQPVVDAYTLPESKSPDDKAGAVFATVASVVVPTALGTIGKLGAAAEGAEAAAARAIDPNKLTHIFGNAEHNLEPVVKALGSQEAAFNALHTATQAAVRAESLTGVFETVVEVGGAHVTVRGAVVDGAVRIGTAFIP
jgi:hypothetical protein